MKILMQKQWIYHFGCILKVLLCVAAVVLVAPLAIATESFDDNHGWLERIAAQYEASVIKADVRLARAEASVVRCQDILDRAKTSGSSKVQVRASKVLTEAKGLREKALADKAAAQKALASLRKGMAAPDLVGAEGVILAVSGGDAQISGGLWGDADEPLGSLELGNSISTGPDGGADLHLRDADGTESRVRVGASSRMKVQQGSEEQAPPTLLLEQGEIHVADRAEGPNAEIAREKQRSLLDHFLACMKQEPSLFSKCLKSYQSEMIRRSIRTPNAVCAVRGTDYVLRYDQATGVTTLLVLEGEVALFSDSHRQAVLVQAGQGARADQRGVFLIPEPMDMQAEKLRWEE